MKCRGIFIPPAQFQNINTEKISRKNGDDNTHINWTHKPKRTNNRKYGMPRKVWGRLGVCYENEKQKKKRKKITAKQKNWLRSRYRNTNFMVGEKKFRKIYSQSKWNWKELHTFPLCAFVFCQWSTFNFFLFFVYSLIYWRFFFDSFTWNSSLSLCYRSDYSLAYVHYYAVCLIMQLETIGSDWARQRVFNESVLFRFFFM